MDATCEITRIVSLASPAYMTGRVEEPAVHARYPFTELDTAWYAARWISPRSGPGAGPLVQISRMTPGAQHGEPAGVWWTGDMPFAMFTFGGRAWGGGDLSELVHGASVHP